MLRRRPRALVALAGAVLAGGVLAACAGGDEPDRLMTLTETQAWVEEMLERGRQAADIEALAGDLVDKCRAAGYNPGTVEFRRCFDRMEARLVALAKAGALARLGEALKRSPRPPAPLIGVQPEMQESVACYDRARREVVGCQDI